MTDVDYILNEIKDKMQEVFSDCEGDHSKYDSSIDAVIEGIEAVIEKEIDDRDKTIGKLTCEVVNTEEALDEITGERDQLLVNEEEAELAKESLSFVAMFRRAGGYCQDATYNEKPLY